MKEFKTRVNVEQEKDVQSMAEAAEQTVKTLQSLLEQKKESLN